MSTVTEIPQLDQVLEKMSYGYYLVASRKSGAELESQNEDWISAATVSWAMQSSFNPPLITIAVKKASNLNETIQRAQAFSLTILGQGEKELIKEFAHESDISGHKINGIQFETGQETGAPVLKAGIATLECRLEDALTPPGDHMLFVGRIVDAEFHNEDTPLTTLSGPTYGGTK